MLQFQNNCIHKAKLKLNLNFFINRFVIFNKIIMGKKFILENLL